MNQIGAKDLDELILGAAEDRGGKKALPCATAFELARAHDVPLAELGASCDRLGVRIVRCQLGCFGG